MLTVKLKVKQSKEILSLQLSKNAVILEMFKLPVMHMQIKIISEDQQKEDELQFEAPV